MSRWRGFGFACVLLVFFISSCRVPEPPLAEDRAVGTIYDPATADAIAARFSESPAQTAQRERFRKALALPVSVVAWEEDHSESRVFYATNRTPDFAAEGTACYGPAWGRELSLGTCRVWLPRGERGTVADGPKLTARLTGWLAGKPEGGAAGSRRAGVVSSEPLAGSDFHRQLREAVARSAERDLLLFVHGFNVNFEAAVTRATQIGVDLPFNGAIVAYSWPSQGGIGNYEADERIVGESVEPFVRFLVELEAAVPRETTLHILVHSMGNRLVLGGLNRLPQRFREPPRFANVVLAAPDVGISQFASLAPGAAAVAKRVTLYVHGSDTALIASKNLHREQRIGDAFPPVAAAGVETIDASRIDTSFMGHSYYGSNRRVLSDLFAVIKEDRGAGERDWLAPRTDSTGTWWEFAALPTEVRWVWHFEDAASRR